MQLFAGESVHLDQPVAGAQLHRDRHPAWHSEPTYSLVTITGTVRSELSGLTTRPFLAAQIFL